MLIQNDKKSCAMHNKRMAEMLRMRGSRNRMAAALGFI